jgi:hypothetical protein
MEIRNGGFASERREYRNDSKGLHSVFPGFAVFPENSRELG